MQRRILLSTMLGNFLQVYDVAIYAFLAPILAQLFFPGNEEVLAIIKTFFVFFMGFLARPLGAIVFGHLGDRIGRKYSLIVSVLVMAAVTLMIGLTPTYETIGIYAGLLLVFWRFLQGFSSGGEIMGGVIFLVEHAPQQSRGLHSGYAVMGGNLGALIAAILCGVLTNVLAPQTLNEWGWRLPFIFSAIGGFLTLYIRFCIPETEVFENISAKHLTVEKPFLEMIRHHKLTTFFTMCLGAVTVVSIYLIFAFMTTYLNVILKYSLGQALLVTILVLAAAIIAMPISGKLSDLYGRKPIFSCALLSMSIGILIFYSNASLHQFSLTVLSSFLVSIPIGAIISVANIMMTELAPDNLRYSITTFGYSIGDAIFGGATPLVATLLIKYTGNVHAPAYYLALICILVLTAVYFMPRLRQITSYSVAAN